MYLRKAYRYEQISLFFVITDGIISGRKERLKFVYHLNTKNGLLTVRM
jgi:hypothetical protein